MDLGECAFRIRRLKANKTVVSFQQYCVAHLVPCIPGVVQKIGMLEGEGGGGRGEGGGREGRGRGEGGEREGGQGENVNFSYVQ